MLQRSEMSWRLQSRARARNGTRGIRKMVSCLFKCGHQSSPSSSSASFSGSSSLAAGVGAGRSRRAHDMASDFFIATSILAAIMLTILLLTSITCKRWRGAETTEEDRADATAAPREVIKDPLCHLRPTSWSSAQTPSPPQIPRERWAEGRTSKAVKTDKTGVWNPSAGAPLTVVLFAST